MPAGRRSRLRVEARRWIEVGAVVSCSILAEKRRSAELDLGCRKPLDHLHVSTAKGADPESKSANRARSERCDGIRFCTPSPVSEHRVAAIERAGDWPESRSYECERSRGGAGGAGSVVGTPQREASSGAFCFCEPNPSSET